MTCAYSNYVPLLILILAILHLSRATKSLKSVSRSTAKRHPTVNLLNETPETFLALKNAEIKVKIDELKTQLRAVMDKLEMIRLIARGERDPLTGN